MTDLRHCEVLYLGLEAALSPGDRLTLLVSGPEERSVLIAAPLSDTVLLGDIAAVLHHLGVLVLLLGLGAPHDLVLGGEDPHTAPGFVDHLQTTHRECLHLETSGSVVSGRLQGRLTNLALHLSDLHTNLLPPLLTGFDELRLTTAAKIWNL